MTAFNIPIVKQDLLGKWALITGASSGFGVDFATLLAARGASLVLVARRAEPMEGLADSLRRQHNVRVIVEPADLAEPGIGEALKQRTDARGIAIDILINNAGCGVYGDFIDQPLEKTMAMLRVNMLGLTELTYIYGRDMARRGGGHMLLVAAVGAYHATPTYAAFAGSKAFVLLFGEALHEELKSSNVVVRVLSPPISDTAFLSVSGQRATPYQQSVMMASRTVAHTGLQALFSGKASVVPGLSNKLILFVGNRLTPRGMLRKIAKFLMKN